MCTDKDLEQLFATHNYKTQILNLAKRANELAVECLEMHSNPKNRENLLKSIASLELLVSQFKNHYTSWDIEITKFKHELKNLYLLQKGG